MLANCAKRRLDSQQKCYQLEAELEVSETHMKASEDAQKANERAEEDAARLTES